MKIIQNGKKEQLVTYILDCPSCGCVAEFTNADIQVDRDGFYVVCPQCGRINSFGSSAIRVKDRVDSLQSTSPCWKPSEQEKGALRTAIHILTEERNFPKAAEQLQNILNAFDGEEPRKVWKPTERQLNKLYNIAYGIPDDDDAKVLMEILEGISKL